MSYLIRSRRRSAKQGKLTCLKSRQIQQQQSLPHVRIGWYTVSAKSPLLLPWKPN